MAALRRLSPGTYDFPMGIERARVVEVHGPTSAAGRVGSGYFVDDRHVLTARSVVGRRGVTDVRPSGTVAWMSATPVWSSRSGDAALLEVDDWAELLLSAVAPRWGQVGGQRPVAVTAMAFPPADVRPDLFRDADLFFGRLTPADGPTPLPVTADPASRVLGSGLSGAALFSGAELVGVLLGAGDLRAVPVAALATDPGFVRLLGNGSALPLTPVTTPAVAFPIL
jgi:hypothetical protein